MDTRLYGIISIITSKYNITLLSYLFSSSSFSMGKTSLVGPVLLMNLETSSSTCEYVQLHLILQCHLYMQCMDA